MFCKQLPMALSVSLDALISMRSAAVAVVAAASVASPFVVKSDALGSGSHASPAPPSLVHGGIEFQMPRGWLRLPRVGHGKGSATHDRQQPAKRSASLGAVSGAVCPRSSGTQCADGMRVAFVTYPGGGSASLPALEVFERQLDEQLPGKYVGFRRVGAAILPGADGMQYLSYTYVRRIGHTLQQQRLAAYRLAGGSGVVAVASGGDVGAQARQVTHLFASARTPLER